MTEIEAQMREVARGESPPPRDAALPSVEPGERRHFLTAQLSEQEAERIAASRMDSRHDQLDALVDEDPSSDWRKPEDRQRDIAQAIALREQARQGGLRFEVFLPPRLAEWILDLVARGFFTDPSEAVFVMLGEQQDLSAHADLRQEILKRSIQASLDDPRPGLSLEEFQEKMRVRREQPRAEPAAWIRTKYS